jgi:WD40 repeat protein
VSISSDAKDLFLWKGEKDHYGALIDTTTWKTKCEFKDAEVHPIAASCILGNGQIATGGTDGHVTVWDIGNGKRIASYRLDKSTIISIRCRNSTDQLIAATADGMLGMLTVKTKKLSLRPGDPISCMAVSPDGKIVGIGYGDSTASSYDKINQGMVRVLEIP